MFKRVKELGLALAVVMVWTGCAKEPVQQSGTAGQSVELARETGTAVITQAEAADPANPHNPFDAWGERHNELLSAADLLLQQHGDTTADAKRRYFLEAVKVQTGKDGAAGYDRSMKYYQQYRKQPEALLKERSAHFQQYYSRIQEEVSGLQSLEAVPGFIIRTRALETSVLKDKQLPEEDRKALLIATAIARHSAAWWQNKLIRTKDAPGETGRSFWNRLLGLHAAVNGDIFGALVGLLLSDSLEDVVECSGAVSWMFDWWVANNW